MANGERTVRSTTMDAIHAERREPAAPQGPLDLAAAGEELAAEAGRMRSGRAARALTPGVHAPLSQTLVALREGVSLSEHDLNGPATMQVLSGRITIENDEQALELSAGQWGAAPGARERVQAHEDSVVLLTVAPNAGP
jgi:quercetin dioxygenase-like cupin family protein